MSSSGLLFVADHPLSPGLKVEILLSWPVKLDKRIPLKLVVQGQVVRAEGGDEIHIAVMIKRHEFRTSS
jgi:hypothetical protein